MRQKLLLGLLLFSVFIGACNRAIGTQTVITTPAVNTLIASGTKPAPLESPLPLPSTPSATDEQPEQTAPAGSPDPIQTALPLNKDALYAVIGLGEADLLNVRTDPGLAAHVQFTLPPQARDLKPTGQEQVVDESTWLEVSLSDGSTGWVSAQFLTEQVEADMFCQDPQVSDLLDRFTASIKDRDGEALAGMVSPVHGLTLYHNVWNPPVPFDSAEGLRRLYLSTEEYDWGIQDGSGLPLVGSFKELVYPKLQDVLAYAHTRHCNVLEQNISVGGTSGLVFWPAEFANLNYYALYRAAPASQELNWRTWVVGIEYVHGVPYLAALVQFYWEI